MERPTLRGEARGGGFVDGGRGERDFARDGSVGGEGALFPCDRKLFGIGRSVHITLPWVSRLTDESIDGEGV